MSQLEEISQKLLSFAKEQAVVDADVLAIRNTSDAFNVRHGNIETVEREDAQGIGLRAFVQQKGGLAFASASSSDFSDNGLRALAKQVVDMAQVSAPDSDAMPPAGAPHPEALTQHPLSADIWQREQAITAAIQCEEAALNASNSIQNSDGASAAYGLSHQCYASADGFVGSHSQSYASLSVSVIAQQGQDMQRDYDYSRAVTGKQLDNAANIGRLAAQRTSRRLGAKSTKSGTMTVMFEPRVAVSLLGHLSAAVNARSIMQKTSFLNDAINQDLFPKWVTIHDLPDHPLAWNFNPFDGEGCATQEATLIDQGTLCFYPSNRYVAKRMGIPHTAHAQRGLTGDIGIGLNNLLWQPGQQSQQELISDISHGVLITELMGSGVNGVTGDYSRGAAGFMIENGVITHPLHEMTIAGNLTDMFKNIRAVGSDLRWFGSRGVASVVIDGMTVAGQS
ncbi:MAG: TldD/PmbA family protein [Mariprofundaceae bacterium]|nr:TldD/PmbA family protein [Mariprofundaceae bacterium]